MTLEQEQRSAESIASSILSDAGSPENKFLIRFSEKRGYLDRFETQSACDSDGMPLNWGYGVRSAEFGYADVRTVSSGTVEVFKPNKKRPDLFWYHPWGLLMSEPLAIALRSLDVDPDLSWLPINFVRRDGKLLDKGMLAFSRRPLAYWLSDNRQPCFATPDQAGRDLSFCYACGVATDIWIASQRCKEVCESKRFTCLEFAGFRCVRK
jgi:hypothetical protein